MPKTDFQCKECLSQILSKDKGLYCPLCKEYKSENKIEDMPEIIDCEDED